MKPETSGAIAGDIQGTPRRFSAECAEKKAENAEHCMTCAMSKQGK
jgi:hypothetical protein